MYNRMHYKLTTPIKPNDPNRTDADVIFPSLNQTAKDVLTRAMMDPFTSHWFNVYFYGMLKRTNETQAIAHQKFKHLKFDTIEDFITIYNFFIPQQEVSTQSLWGRWGTLVSWNIGEDIHRDSIPSEGNNCYCITVEMKEEYRIPIAGIKGKKSIVSFQKYILQVNTELLR